MDRAMFLGGLLTSGVAVLFARFGPRLGAWWLGLWGMKPEGTGWNVVRAVHLVGAWLFILVGLYLMIVSFFVG